MAAQFNPDFEAKVYEQAGEWVRLANHITWTVGAVFVPLSLAPIAIVVQSGEIQREERLVLAGGSLVLYLLWFYVTRMYRNTTIHAREVLMKIEVGQHLPVERSLYCHQGQPAKRWFSVDVAQIVMLLLLVALWIPLLLGV